MKQYILAFAAVLLVLMTGLLAAGCSKSEEEEYPTALADQGTGTLPPEFTIVAIGNSLTAGLGLPESEAYPAVLQERLRQAGYDVDVINAGNSGETSRSCLGRIEWLLTLNPDIVLLCTGANDGLRGLSAEQLEENLQAIVEKLLAADVKVLFFEMKMVRNLGPDYTAAFETVYPRVADRYPITYVPFFLEGVAGNPALNQDDGIHPNADGYQKAVDNIYPTVIEVIN